MTAIPARRAVNPMQGILWQLGAGFIFVVMDAAGKYLTDEYSTVQISWARFAFHILTALVLIAVTDRGWTLLRSARPGLQLWRSALLAGATGCYFLAVRYIPLADAAAIGFVSPFILTVLSVPLLGETVGSRRWVAVGIGFVAVLLIIRPGFGMTHWAMLLPLAVAAFFALYQIATRKLGPVDDGRTTLVYSGIVGFVACSLLLPIDWVWPDPFAWGLMIFMGVAGGISHFFMIRAFTLAPASLLAPFSYVQLVWATLIGYLVFHDLPDRWTLAGAAAITLAGLYIWHRERALGREIASATAAGKG